MQADRFALTLQTQSMASIDGCDWQFVWASKDHAFEIVRLRESWLDVTGHASF